jgi:hypothetical protein
MGRGCQAHSEKDEKVGSQLPSLSKAGRWGFYMKFESIETVYDTSGVRGEKEKRKTSPS